MTNVLSYSLGLNATVLDTCLGPDNNIWSIGNVSTAWYLWKITPAGVVTTYSLPASYGGTTGCSICADSTYIYVSTQNTSSFPGIRQYTTSGVLNATLGTSASNTVIGDQMCFDGTNLWTVHGSYSLVRTTLAGVVTTFNAPSFSWILYSIVYDAGSSCLFIGSNNNNYGNLIKVSTATPSTMTIYSTTATAADPHQCTDGTYIWQCNDWKGITSYLIANPATHADHAISSPSFFGNFWYVKFDGTSLWMTNQATSGSPTGFCFVSCSPASPTAVTVVVPIGAAPGPGSNMPMCIGPSSQSPPKAPWAFSNPGSPAYGFTISTSAASTPNPIVTII